MKRYGIFLIVRQVNGDCQMVHVDTEDNLQLAQVNAQDRALANGGRYTIMPVFNQLDG